MQTITSVTGICKSKWSGPMVIWLLAGVASATGLLPLVHLASATVLIVVLLTYEALDNPWLKVLCWFVILTTALFMALYRPEGFSYFNTISVTQLHDQGKPYQQFVNLGKFFAGLIIFFWLMQGCIKKDIVRAFHPTNLLIAASAALGILLVGSVLLNLQFITKFTQIALVFLAVNLLVTCFAEETFYRLLVQRPSEKAFTHIHLSRIFGVLVASAVFTLTHFSNQPQILATMFVAGLLYATTFALTRSLTSAILAHFSVNALHFLFLTYPI